MREVFFDGMERVRVRALMTPPRIIGHGWKPRRPGHRARAVRTARELRGRVRSVCAVSDRTERAAAAQRR